MMGQRRWHGRAVVPVYTCEWVQVCLYTIVCVGVSQGRLPVAATKKELEVGAGAGMLRSEAGADVGCPLFNVRK